MSESEMPDQEGSPVSVAYQDRRWIIDADHSLTLGRSERPALGERPAIVGLDADDTGISRLAGRIRIGSGAVVLDNLSTTRPLLVE